MNHFVYFYLGYSKLKNYESIKFLVPYPITVYQVIYIHYSDYFIVSKLKLKQNEQETSNHLICLLS